METDPTAESPTKNKVPHRHEFDEDSLSHRWECDEKRGAPPP